MVYYRLNQLIWNMWTSKFLFYLILPVVIFIKPRADRISNASQRNFVGTRWFSYVRWWRFEASAFQFFLIITELLSSLDLF